MEEKQLLDKIESRSRIDADLIWILAEVKEKKLYRDWGYTSFSGWVQGKCKGFLSPSYAYALASIGKTFSSQKEKITTALSNRSVTIPDLRDSASRVARGLSVEQAIDSLSGETILPEEVEKQTAQNDEEASARIVFYCPRGDLKNIFGNLLVHALCFGQKNFNEVFRDIFTGSLRIEDVGEKYFLRFSKLIEEGKFFCAACNDIPLVPNLHHVVPVSLASGYGPQALLCEECHLGIVQKRWKIFCRKWGFNWREIKAEAEKLLKETGKVPKEPTVIVTGEFLNCKR